MYTPKVGDKVKFIETSFGNSSYTRALQEAGVDNRYTVVAVINSHVLAGERTVVNLTGHGLSSDLNWVIDHDYPVLVEAISRRRA